MLNKNVRPWLLAIGLIPLALTLTGCFGGPSIPNLGGGGGDDNGAVDDELVEDLVEGSGGDVDFESGSLPADFPVDEVPLVDGEIATALSVNDGQAWTVYINVPDQATAESAAGLLEAAGYTYDGVFAWETDAYLVVVLPQESEDGWLVYYQVQVQQ
jgi:hypothetical protein